MTKTICTSLSLQSVYLYQLQQHSQHEYTIADPTNKSPCALTALNNKVNKHAQYIVCLIIFTTYLFSCVNFSWIQLTLKIYYHQKFPDLQYSVKATVQCNLSKVKRCHGFHGFISNYKTFLVKSFNPYNKQFTVPQHAANAMLKCTWTC